MLGGVDHDPGAGHLADGAVQLRECLGVAVEIGLGRRAEPGGDHGRDVAVAVDTVLEGDHLVGVDLVPPAEGGLADPAPEVAFGDGRAATAELAFDQAPLPEEDDLPRGAEPGQLAEDALDQRAPAAAEAADVQDLLRAGTHRRDFFRSNSPSTSSSNFVTAAAMAAPSVEVAKAVGSPMAFSTSSNISSWLEARWISPSSAIRRAKRCWWLSTCSPRSAERGTTIGTRPRRRASMIVAGPPWQTTAMARPM